MTNIPDATAGAGSEPDLAARLRILEAKDEIRDLFSRYGLSADTGDAKRWSEVWAKDAVFRRGDAVVSGREAFFNSIQDPNGIHKKQIEGKGSLHTNGPLMIQVDGNDAWVEGSALVWVRKDEGYSVFSLSHNHWTLRRTNGRWEVVERLSLPVAPDNAGLVYRSWSTAD